MVVVDHIVRVASILSMPDLEDETKKVINQYIRDGLQKPTAPTGINPYEPRAKAEDMLGANVVSEWLDGGKEEPS